MNNTTIMRREAGDESVELAHLHPVLQRIYLARHVTAKKDLSRELVDLYPFSTLLNINKAIERLYQALSQQQRILVIGDFDADGATSSALAVSALRQLGANHVFYLVPNRFTYGYGLTPEIVDHALRFDPQLIITVDNGISSIAGVARANQLGIDVLITDHHLPAESLPEAYAIVNPNQPDDQFPSKMLAGVGVIFYVMLALRSYLKQCHWFSQQDIVCPNMSQFLDLVALGTVADVVPLDRNNRILVHQGLQRIRNGCLCPGIKALIEVSGRQAEKLKTTDLGFMVAPRLNAAGRLDDMSLGIACLLTQDEQEALELAHKLDDLNKERRVIEEHMRQDAFAALANLDLTNDLARGLCLYQEDWHQGVVGLVASRVKDKVNRPVIAFAKADEQNLKGSARSVQGLHIRDVLESVAKQNPDLIDKFGGHAMAAGLSIPITAFTDFKQAFADEVAKHLSEEDLRGKIFTDGELVEQHITLDVAELLQDAGPWGQSFPEPIFDGRFIIAGQRIVGQRHLKLVLQLPSSNHYIDAILFNVDLDQWPNHNCRSVEAAYRLDINEYNNRRRVQFIIEQLCPVEMH